MGDNEPEVKAEIIMRNSKRLLFWAAGLSIGALLAHIIDLPDHLTEWWGYSSFYMASGTIQFLYGFLLIFQPWRYDETGGVRSNGIYYGRPYYMLGIIITGVVVLFYVFTRSIGMPFAGAPPEKITLPSLVFIVEDLPLLYALIRLYVVTKAAIRI
jgi:hypothetical protein